MKQFKLVNTDLDRSFKPLKVANLTKAERVILNYAYALNGSSLRWV